MIFRFTGGDVPESAGFAWLLPLAGEQKQEGEKEGGAKRPALRSAAGRVHRCVRSLPHAGSL